MAKLVNEHNKLSSVESTNNVNQSTLSIFSKIDLNNDWSVDKKDIEIILKEFGVFLSSEEASGITGALLIFELSAIA